MSMRCLLVDDSARFVEAARALLERDGVTVVGVASTGAQALARAAELAPDVVLLDLDLAGESGLDLAVRLARRVSSVIILISTHSLDDFHELVAASPAHGFLHKSSLSARAIRELLPPEPGHRRGEGPPTG
jgi:two-component system nitrate/nitrite response regulator NarL